MASKRINCPTELNRDTGHALLADLAAQKVEPGDAVILDFARTSAMDALGGAWLVEVADRIRSGGGEFRFEGQSGSVAEFIHFIEPGLTSADRGAKPKKGFLERIGEVALSIWAELDQALNLIIDAIYWTFLGPIEGRGFRWGFLIDEMYEMGVRAIGINSLMNFLLGLIIAMLSAAQLAKFGVGIYVADGLMIGFARELAAVMTAVVVSARTGAAIAAELATMQVQEEIDALRGMGLKVPQFLVAPKVLALLLVTPCLMAIGMIAGIAGGSIWGIFFLHIRSDVWFRETLNAATVGDIFQGMIKTFFFAFAIVLVGCHNGLRVEGGSRGVGLMTTRAVVMDIFLIIVIDMAFATLFYYIL